MMNTSGIGGKPSNRAWKFFASVKLSVVVLLTLAATSVIGTVIPQNASPMMYIQRYGENLYQVFKLLGFFDMYDAWWFQLLLGVLTVNIIVCSIDRLSSTWKIIFPKKINFQASRFRKSPNRLEWSEKKAPERLKNVYFDYVQKRYRHVKNQEKEDGLIIFGEKGRWTRLGVYAVHFSIILMIIGGLLGSLFGYEGFVNIHEGESARHAALKEGSGKKELPFAIRCEDFSLARYDSGMPKEYRSTLSILNDGKVVKKAEVRVNDPLRHKGIKIFQSSYGRFPEEGFTMVFKDPASGMKYERKASIGSKIEMPAGKGSLLVKDFSADFNFRGHSIGEALLCTLVPSDENAPRQNIIVSVSFPRFDRMRGGDFVISVKDLEFGYYTGLQVTKDPGVPVVYAGFIIIIIGCWITFFMQHKQVCIELTKRKNRTDIMLACTSGKNRPGMKSATGRLARQLKRLQDKNEG